MRKRWLAVLVLLTALGLVAPTASADNGKGKGRGNPHAEKRFDKDKDRDDARWERHDRFEVRTYGPQDGRPPGWSRGNKTGWGNCGLPPGQAKKYGCRTYVFGGRRYYYYNDDAGRIVVRRPRIDVRAVVH